ncbi:MAG: phenylalanyl-tRNA synthetase alpha chain [Parcubacteria group bacterium LiPW_15]|nr:MAG: phenylalanyl-tRNA synthetase alpha chain [Parcubacteria group bacterium LiPW_15]
MNLGEIGSSAREAINSATTREALEQIRLNYLGRKGELTEILRSLKELPVEERRVLGSEANVLRVELENMLADKTANFGEAGEMVADITAPGKKVSRGHLHPLSRVMADASKIFAGMNFSVVTGPEAETEYYNFDALNIPANHPAREMWDTFWLKSGKGDKQKMLLRTHTSPMQMRFMEKSTPPFQIVVPGRCFRYEATDMSHEVNFYQLEGLMVGKDVNLGNFKFIIEEFLKKFFVGQKIEFRFRPSYFPFVEPGVEVDIKLKGKWLEIMGAGMVHPRVFEYAHYNPKDWQGFAFGVGIDRLAMIKYGVPDIRLFYSGDLRFLKQF